MELLVAMGTLCCCGVVIVSLFYASDLGWDMNGYLILLFFLSLTLLGVSMIALLSRSGGHNQKTTEEEKLALMDRLQKTLENETSRLRTYNRLEP